MKHVKTRDGRHYARVVVPKEPPGLRRILGKNELTEPLGADKRQAERNSHAVVAGLLQRIEDARRQLASEGTRVAAQGHFRRALERDDVIRSHWGDARMAEHAALFTPSRAARLRLLAAGRIDDDEAEALIGYAADEAIEAGEYPADLRSSARLKLLRDHPAEEVIEARKHPADPDSPEGTKLLRDHPAEEAIEAGEYPVEELIEVGERTPDSPERIKLLRDLAAPHSPGRMQLLRDLAAIELEVLAAIERRNQGLVGTIQPTHPLLNQEPSPEPVPVHPRAKGRVMGPDSLKPLSELLVAFHAERRGRVAERTTKEHQVAVRMLEEFLGGPRPVADITSADVRVYKKALMETPNRYAMRFPDLTLPEAIEANAARAEPFPVLDAATINEKWLSHIRSVLTWCVGAGIIPDNPATGIKVDTGRGHREAPRVPFSNDDLGRIFGSKLFAPGAAYGTHQWALLVALFSGARSSSEIARIRLEDIYEEQGVLVFHLADASKNERSKRLVPVHQSLIALGLPAYVDKLRKGGKTLLFPDWIPEDKINRWFLRTYRAEVGIHDQRKVFHSFRHSLKTALARAGVARDVSDLITGHQDQSVAGIYIHDKQTTMIGAMADGLNRVAFPAIDTLIASRAA